MAQLIVHLRSNWESEETACGAQIANVKAVTDDTAKATCKRCFDKEAKDWELEYMVEQEAIR